MASVVRISVDSWHRGPKHIVRRWRRYGVKVAVSCPSEWSARGIDGFLRDDEERNMKGGESFYLIYSSRELFTHITPYST